ncbi:hypothetical protein K1F50_20850 [Muricauda oceani]|uniref:Uncharacterized protein n=1 Tax=Flagellimonas oceani TaxID=2698672 RepID=A0A6G7J6W2_9FLAO|nr:hypothetical protein [Allomuricauda oceani]MBW8245259.1 hypothetical protein [Allomuricauda oceani]QII46430.1 hypothetical protein GVT53_17655 [Allomuricauda oceani]
MEILNPKKEIMQVVRFILFFAIFPIVINSCYGQNTLSGNFIYKSPTVMVNDIGVEYSFDDDGTFNRTKLLHLGSKELSKGLYTISKDTLILQFEPYGKMDTIKDVTILGKNKLQSLPIFDNSNNCLIKIYVKDVNGVPLKGTNLLLKDLDNKTLIALVSDESGEFPELNMQSPIFQKLILSTIEHKEIEIYTEPFFGYSSSIEVKLKPIDIIHKNMSIEKRFLIQERTKNKIKLIQLPNKEKIILTRQPSD